MRGSDGLSNVISYQIARLSTGREIVSLRFAQGRLSFGLLAMTALYNQPMKAAVAQRLIKLNREFYQKLAGPFSASRARLQPGVLRVLESVPGEANLLDLGCGNGGVARDLTRRGHSGRYAGIDFSKELLRVANSRVDDLNATFLHADLTSSNWNEKLPLTYFDFVLSFAVLHHIPSRELRLQSLKQVRSLLAPSGRFVHSNWQFLNSPRLRARIQPWSAINLDETQVDSGDYLLDWRSGGQGLRYVHHFNETELAELAVETGFEIKETFLSDGKSGDLSLYSVWQASGTGF
jgi:SAM-dependent methyltransferase